MTACDSAFSEKIPACEQINSSYAACNGCIKKSFDIIECIRFCFQKWLIIVTTAVLCALIAAAIHQAVPPVYESTAKLYILTSNSNEIRTSELQAGSMLLSDYREVFKTWEFHNLVQQQTQTALNYQQLQDMLTVETPDDTRLVYITIRHPDAALACKLANASAQAARLFIEERLHGLQPAIFSTAIIPGVPSGLSVFLYVAIAFAFGAMLAVGSCVLVFCLDDRIRAEDELKMVSGLTVLSDEKDYNSLLLASRLIHQKVRCVVLTGADQASAQHFASRNLLDALAALHRKTVLIRLEHSPDNCVGISDYLDGHCDADSLLQPVENLNASLLVIRTGSEALPAQLFHPRMECLIDSLKKQFDMILIDAAPLDRYADASAFFPFCDGAVLTAVRSHSKRKNVMAQSASLNEAGCRALGAVLIQPSVKRYVRSSLCQGAAV